MELNPPGGSPDPGRPPDRNHSAPPSDSAKGIPGVLSQLGSKPAKQSALLFGSQIAVMGLGIITGTINTRILGPEDYGLMSFFWAITMFGGLFIHFGLFSTGQIMLAGIEDEEAERRLIGSLLLLGIVVGIFYALFVIGISFIVDPLFHTHAKGLLRWFAPFVIFLPLQILLQQAGIGTNRIGDVALLNVAPLALYIPGILVTYFFFEIRVHTVILLNFIAIGVSCAAVTVRFRPLFRGLRDQWALIWAGYKEYGVHLYLGMLADQTTMKLDSLLVPYFAGTTALGYYSLALRIVSPIALLSQSLSTSLFKRFAREDRIARKVLIFNLAWLVVSTLAVILVARWVITLLFGPSFLPVVVLVVPLAVAGFLGGFYQPYNLFLWSKGRGKWLRNMSFIMTGANLAGHLTFIPLFGAFGAGIGKGIGNAGYSLSALFYYRKHRSEGQE